VGNFIRGINCNRGYFRNCSFNILGEKPIKLPTVWHSWPMMSPIEFG
jgi:hypothetical protein